MVLCLFQQRLFEVLILHFCAITSSTHGFNILLYFSPHREYLGQTKKALAPFMSRYDIVTHGLGPKTFEVTVQILEAYLRHVIQQLTEQLES